MTAARVLVVDDLPTNRMMVKAALASSGFDVSEAADGEEALAALDGSSVDLMILDYMMPGLSGMDVLKSVRETFEETALPVIILSGEEGNDKVEAFLKAGANDYMIKPFDFSILAVRARTLVGYKLAIDELKSLKG